MGSLVDPSYELTDPCPDIHALFIQFDAAFFDGKLGGCEVKWSPRMTSCAGMCYYEGNHGLCSIRLSKPLLSLRPRRDLVETLLHEMIHAFLFVEVRDRDHDGHGTQFQWHMLRINKEGGTNITIYHNFHAEVRNYQKHVWRCDGPCRDASPYHGWVRRAMNRAPGPNDLWYNDHQRACGGSFIKQSEPKKAAKGRGEKKKIEGEGVKKMKIDDKQQSIDMFFTKKQNVDKENQKNVFVGLGSFVGGAPTGVSRLLTTQARASTGSSGSLVGGADTGVSRLLSLFPQAKSSPVMKDAVTGVEKQNGREESRESSSEERRKRELANEAEEIEGNAMHGEGDEFDSLEFDEMMGMDDTLINYNVETLNDEEVMEIDTPNVVKDEAKEKKNDLSCADNIETTKDELFDTKSPHKDIVLRSAAKGINEPSVNTETVANTESNSEQKPGLLYMKIERRIRSQSTLTFTEFMSMSAEERAARREERAANTKYETVLVYAVNPLTLSPERSSVSSTDSAQSKRKSDRVASLNTGSTEGSLLSATASSLSTDARRSPMISAINADLNMGPLDDEYSPELSPALHYNSPERTSSEDEDEFRSSKLSPAESYNSHNNRNTAHEDEEFKRNWKYINCYSPDKEILRQWRDRLLSTDDVLIGAADDEWDGEGVDETTGDAPDPYDFTYDTDE